MVCVTSTLCGDGDSSVYPTLKAGWGYAIEKQECANHALKYF